MPPDEVSIDNVASVRSVNLMKLLRYGAPGQEKPGFLDAQGQIRDLSAIVPDPTGETIAPEALARLRAVDPTNLQVVQGNPRLGPASAASANSSVSA